MKRDRIDMGDIVTVWLIGFVLCFILFAQARSQSLVPVSAERATPNAQWSQESWSKCAVHASGQLARVYTSGGPDVTLHLPGHAPQIVNTYTQGVQDEPEIQATPEGFIVAWDQRDPVYMHIDYMRFSVDGTALSGAVQIDEQPTAWRPLVAVREDGLVAFCFTGSFGNRAFIRLLNPDSTWLTPSIEVGTHANEQDPAICWLPDDSLFVVWTDFTATGGLRLLQRVFSPVSGAFVSSASVVAPNALPGQRWPTCRLGPEGEPWVAWQAPEGAWLKRGSLAPELIAPHGKLPELAPPHVVYERDGNVYAYPSAQQLNSTNIGTSARPSVTVGPYGTVWTCWQANGDAFIRPWKVTP